MYLFFIWYNIGFLYGFVFGPQRCTILNESMTFTWDCDPWFLWSNRISVWCKTFVCRLSIFLACGSVSVRQSDFCHHINQISFGDIFSELNSKFLYCLWAVYFLNCELHNYLEASLVYLLFPVVCMFCLLSYSTKYTWMYLWWLSNFDTSHIQREKERKKNILSRMIK